MDEINRTKDVIVMKYLSCINFTEVYSESVPELTTIFLLKFGTKIVIMLEPHPIFRGEYSTFQLRSHSILINSRYE